jgi:hypothetical protein
MAAIGKPTILRRSRDIDIPTPQSCGVRLGY